MTDLALHRRCNPPSRLRARVTLSSADSPTRRAENIMALAGLTLRETEGTQSYLAEIAAVIEQYAELDRRARGR